MRVSASSLKCTSQPVRMRSSRFALLLIIAATVAGLSPASAQIQARPQFQAAPSTPQVLCPVQVVGNRRIPKESILARTYLQPGDTYDPAAVEQTFNSLWNTGYFDDVRIERVDDPKCVQLLIYVRETPTIREINYKGLGAVTQSD